MQFAVRGMEEEKRCLGIIPGAARLPGIQAIRSAYGMEHAQHRTPVACRRPNPKRLCVFVHSYALPLGRQRSEQRLTRSLSSACVQWRNFSGVNSIRTSAKVGAGCCRNFLTFRSLSETHSRHRLESGHCVRLLHGDFDAETLPNGPGCIG